MVFAVGVLWKFQCVISSIQVLPFHHLSPSFFSFFSISFHVVLCCLRVLLLVHFGISATNHSMTVLMIGVL